MTKVALSGASGNMGKILRPELLKQPNPLDPIARQFQGGQFVTMDYTTIDKRPGEIE